LNFEKEINLSKQTEFPQKIVEKHLRQNPQMAGKMKEIPPIALNGSRSKMKTVSFSKLADLHATEVN